MSAAIHDESDAGRRRVQVPLSAVPREGRPYQGRRAGIVSRLVADAVDAVVVAVLVAAGYLAMSAVLFLWAPSRFHFPRVGYDVLLTAGALVTFAYLTWSWVTTGRTYGDHLLGLRVIDHRGERLRLIGASARAALCVVFPIGVLFVLVSEANRSLQDMVLRTSVIYDWVQTAAPQPPRPPDPRPSS